MFRKIVDANEKKNKTENINIIEDKKFWCQKKNKNNSQKNLTKIQKYEKTKKNVLGKWRRPQHDWL